MALHIANARVAAVFAAYPPSLRRPLLSLRALILQVAAETCVTGDIEETLKWGEPAYVTKSGTGSTVRIDRRKANDSEYAIYFNCQTDLIATFRTLFPRLRFEGNRAIVFDKDQRIPRDALTYCIAAAFTYHQRKGRRTRSR